MIYGIAKDKVNTTGLGRGWFCCSNTGASSALPGYPDGSFLQEACRQPLGGSGGLSKYVNDGDNWGCYMGHRGYWPTY